MKPFFSVIIPCYNSAATMRQTIDGVLASTAPVEVIVVNDGSKDNSEEIALSYGDRIWYVSQENKGIAGARNTGIAMASGEFCHFLDSDDVVLPGFYEKLYASYQADPNVDVMHSDWIYANEHCEPVSRLKSEEIATPAALVLYGQNRLATLSLVARASLVREVGGFDPDPKVQGSEDWELWIRLARAGARFRRVPGFDCIYRSRPDSVSKSFFKMWQAQKAIQAKHADLISNEKELAKLHVAQADRFLNHHFIFLYGNDLKKPWLARRINRTAKLFLIAYHAPDIVPHLIRRAFQKLLRPQDVSGVNQVVTSTLGAILMDIINFF